MVGEFKQGKSSLVNALLNAPVCPVDDDIATSAPTAVRYGTEPAAAVLLKPPEAETRGRSYDEDDDQPDPVREDIPIDQVASYVTEQANSSNEKRVLSVEVSLPRKLLADGIVIVDTPGVGGLGSAHNAATMGALPMADAVIFVSDASQEFTAPELEFLQTARAMCPNIACVMTKVDFYPAWRKIRDINKGHLERRGINARIMPVSSALRIHALRHNDRDLNQESGFPALVGYLQADIAANAESITIDNAKADVVAVTELLEAQFRSEREALADPERAQALVANLTEVKEKAGRLRSGVAKWQQTLTDGVQDLQADVDHDLRNRIRQITKQADESIENTDPVDAWDDFQAWLYRRVAEDVVHSYTFLHARGRELVLRVGEHFGEDGDTIVFPSLAYPTYDVGARIAGASTALAPLSGVASVAGRYAQVERQGRNVRLLLAKNPASWLEAFDMADEAPTLLSINARDPDGLDTSWLFDVDFAPLRGRTVLITGDRAYDLAVRLEVNEVPFRHVRTFGEAVSTVPPGRLEVIANYTAFQDIRAELDRVN